MLRNFSWVINGRLAGMALPTGMYDISRGFHEIERDLLDLKQRGVAAIISFTDQPIPSTAIQKCGMQGLHLPIQDMTAPDLEQVQQFVDYVDAKVDMGGVVAHCSAGMGRTGTMLACYLVWNGQAPDEAMTAIRQLRPGSIETMAQEQVIITFADSLQRKFEANHTTAIPKPPKQNPGEARSARSDELDDVIDVCTAAFSQKAGYDRRPDFDRRIASDPSGTFVDNRILVVDETVVSALRVYDRSVHMGQSLLRCAGIGDVATRPEFQRRGYGAYFLQSTVDTLVEQGYDISWLTGRNDFYNRFGWHECPARFFEVKDVGNFQAVSQSWTVRPLEISKDYQAVQSIYNRFNACLTFSVQRSIAYWDWLDRYRPFLNDNKMLKLGLHRDGVLVGYLFVEQGPSQWFLHEVCCLPPDTGEIALLVGTAAKMAFEAGAERFLGVMPYDHESLLRLKDAGLDCRPAFGNVMFQVLHFGRFLQKITSELEARLQGNTWQGRIALITENEDRTVLTIERDRVAVTDDQAAEFEVVVAASDMTYALLGYWSFSEIRRKSPQSLPKQVRRILACLFPRTNPIFWGTDYI